jgi:ribonuclease VapC
MVIDSSALIAILLGEPEADSFAEVIAGALTRLMSAASALETAIVIEVRKGPAGGRELDLLLHRAQIDLVPFTEAQFEAARFAWRQYGRGNHPAGLNLGDCFAYALSKSSGEPLLFKGDDFARTDVKRVVWGRP